MVKSVKQRKGECKKKEPLRECVSIDVYHCIEFYGKTIKENKDL